MNPFFYYHPFSGRIRFEGNKEWIPLYKEDIMWTATNELRFITRRTNVEVDHQFINTKLEKILQQKWMKETIKDEHTVHVQVEWRDVPHEVV